MKQRPQTPTWLDAVVFHKVLLAGSDVIAVSLGFFLSYTIRNDFFGWRGGIYQPTLKHALFLAGLLVFLFFYFRHRGLYRNRALRNGVEHLALLSSSWLGFYGVFLGLIFFLRIHLFWEHRITMFIFFVLGWLLLVGGRLALVPVALRISRVYKKRPARILCLTSGPEAVRLREALSAEYIHTPHVAGILDHQPDSTASFTPGDHVTDDNLMQMLERESFNEVYLNLHPLDWNQNIRIIRTLSARGIRMRIALDQFGETSKRLPSWPDVDFGYLHINHSLFFDLEQRIKHAIDRAGALCLLVLLTPVLLLIALAIRLESPGPVLFRQNRAGLGGSVFEVLKFRTMKENTESHHREAVRKFVEKDHAFLEDEGQRPGFFKITSSQHVTRIGAFLRKTSLDELPQLINVLRGEMSLVGPRPLPTYEVELFKPWQHYRHEIKPGLTGFWQVYGRSSVSHEDAILMDIFYRLNWSLSLDLRILVRTLFVLMTGKGAL